MIHMFKDNPGIVDYVNTTSTSGTWSRGLSPFVLGPCQLYGEYTSRNVENAWQFAKVYHSYTDKSGDPSERYWEWAKAGWADERAHRYPMGRGAVPLYSWWDGKRLSYVEARKRIYCPLYAAAVEPTPAFQQLQERYKKQPELWLFDFDAYDHRALGMSYKDVLNCPTRKMGHGFVLAMLLEGQRVWEQK